MKYNPRVNEFVSRIEGIARRILTSRSRSRKGIENLKLLENA